MSEFPASVIMPKVLVCDDDDATRDMLVTFLLTEGYEVSGVPDGPSCLAAIAADMPDVLVLDVMMPGMSGIEVMERLRKTHPEAGIKVVMLTARSDDQDVWAGWQAGIDYYIPKPFDPSELLRFVHFVAEERDQEIDPADLS
jgi:DNA-binding response OmpR family regulator